VATVDVSSEEFYGVGYDDSDKRIPDMTIIKRQLGALHAIADLATILHLCVVFYVRVPKF